MNYKYVLSSLLYVLVIHVILLKYNLSISKVNFNTSKIVKGTEIQTLFVFHAQLLVITAPQVIQIQNKTKKITIV